MPSATIDTPLGPLTLVSDGAALTAATFDAPRLGGGSLSDAADLVGDSPDAVGDAVLDLARDQLAAYFDGDRSAFTVPAAPAGTPFQKRVWAALAEIPHGETISYGMLARRVGDARAAQAVGAANGRNPVAVVIPCHRVVGADGGLVGYAGGLDRKRALLELESPQRRLF